MKISSQDLLKHSMGIIYKVTNNFNNKIYIGQTIQPYQKRWNHHLEESKLGSETKFHRAIRKYGKDAFRVEVIEEIPNEDLNEREIYWIDYYNSYNNGYNSTPGGDNPPRNDIPVICIETNTIYNSCKDAERKTGISSVRISECVRHAYNRLTVNNLHWMTVEEYNKTGYIPKKSKNEINSKKVICVETGIVYNSILEASKKTSISRQSIRRSCENITKNPTKFHWNYYNK